MCGPAFVEADHSLVWCTLELQAADVAPAVVVWVDDTDVRTMIPLCAAGARPEDFTLSYSKGRQGLCILNCKAIVEHMPGDPDRNRTRVLDGDICVDGY